MPKTIVGLMGTSVSGGSPQLSTPAQLTTLLHLLQAHQIRELDTARVYGSGHSETLLGQCSPLSHSFSISTKAPGFRPGSLEPSKIEQNCAASLSALQLPKLDIYYFHGPDRQTPLAAQCRAMDTLFRAGRFARFGVCNLRADEVESVHAICRENGYVLPSVYQGGFNPLQRQAEFDLLPTLRKLDMAFYAFSPLGGGFFSRPVAQLRAPPTPGSRMDEMKVFRDMYVNERSLELLERLTGVCAEAGLLVKEATLRWLMHHGPLGEGDGVILGASGLGQVEENLKACEAGELPEVVVRAFAEMWEGYREKAGSYHV